VRASQDNPLIMYLVAPRRPSVPGGELLSQAALAAVLCVQKFESDPMWAGAFAEWEDSSFRKVCLRVRPIELKRARTLAHSESGEVLCFPPRRRSTVEPELSRLQADIGSPLKASDLADAETEPPTMVLLIAEDLQLTVGKACAQVAHAALIARQLHKPAAISAWEHRGCPTAVAVVDRESFERVKADLVVAAVRDAGLTQVAAGTETVLATEPGAELRSWLRAAARTIA
jgi:peptidyl-tRNA hydrolase